MTSYDEILARSFVLDLRTFANSIDLFNAFKKTYKKDLYPILLRLGQKELASSSLRDFKQIISCNYNIVGNMIKFSSDLKDKIMLLYPPPDL